MYKIHHYFKEMHIRTLYLFLSFFITLSLSYFFVDEFFYIFTNFFFEIEETSLESSKKLDIREFCYYDNNCVDLVGTPTLLNNSKAWDFLGGGDQVVFCPCGLGVQGGLGEALSAPPAPPTSLTPSPIFMPPFAPLSGRNPQFIFTDITEAFRTSLLLSFGFAFYIQIPFIIYNIWSFFVPSLFEHERKIFSYFCFFFLFLYILATLIIINFIFPFLCNFFLNFETKTDFLDIHCEARISSYISFILKLCCISHLFFQLPFFSLLFFQLRLFNISDLFIHRRFIYWCFIFFSAMIAPPDLFLQSLISITFLFTLEISLFCLLLLTHYQKVKNREKI